MAIMRHLARKMKLEGSTEAECAMVDMVMDQLQDYTGNITGLCYNQNFSQELLQQWVNATGSLLQLCFSQIKTGEFGEVSI